MEGARVLQEEVELAEDAAVGISAQAPALARTTLAVIAAVALVLSSVIPNAHELMTRWEKTGLGLRERVLVPWACGIGASTCIIGIFLGTYSEFIYFQF